MNANTRVPGCSEGDGQSLPPKPSVGVVGAGRVGAVLGAALIAADYRVTGVSAGSAASRTRAAQLLPGVPVRTVDAVVADAQLVLLTVPDDMLAGLVARLVATSAGGRLGNCRFVAHTSGAHGISVLAPLTVSGIRPLALHPAMTFTGRPSDLDRLAAGAMFGVTAPHEVRPFAERLVADLGGSVEWIAERDRPMYHAALTHGANHLTTLVNEAADRLRDAGVRHPERVLAPLLRAALENTLRLGDAALTGPIARGDAGTVAAHLAVLTARAPDSVPAYLALARRTADRALAAGLLRPVDAESLLDVLAQPPYQPSASGRAGARVGETSGPHIRETGAHVTEAGA